MILNDLICLVHAIDFNFLNAIKSILATQNILLFLKKDCYFFQVIPVTPMDVREIEGILPCLVFVGFFFPILLYDFDQKIIKLLYGVLTAL